MKGTNFNGATYDLVKPEGWTDEQCYSLPATNGVTEDGLPFILTAFKPSPEDLVALNNGGSVFLKVLGTQFAPVSLFTISEDGLINPM